MGSADLEFIEYGFMAGIFSLLDVLFGVPLASIIRDIPLPESVRQALLAGDGELGNLLMLVQSLEQGDCALVERCAKSAGIDAGQLLSAQLETLGWLGELRGDGNV